MRKKARLSLHDRIFLAAHKDGSPYLTQFVIEGEGRIDPVRLGIALHAAAAVNPGVRLKLEGSLWRSGWVIGPQYPQLRELSAGSFHPFGDQEENRLSFDPDIHQGPIAEVILEQGQPTKLVVRALHATMDGQGALYFLQEIFRALNGEQLQGSTLRPSVNTIERSLGKAIYRPPLRFEFVSPTGNASRGSRGYITHKIRVAGQFSALAAQLAMILAGENSRRSAGKSRFAIPVDLRGRVPSARSVSNLLSFIDLEVTPEQSFQAIHGELIRKLYERQDCNYGKLDYLAQFVPLRKIRKNISNNFHRGIDCNRYPHTGVISCMGKVALDTLKTPGFNPTTAYLLPPDNINAPVMVVAVELERFVEITVMAPHCLADEGRMEQLLALIERKLQPKSA